jgi:hypothetical protein
MLEDIVEGIRLNWLNKVKTSYKLVYKHHLVLSSKCHNSQKKTNSTPTSLTNPRAPLCSYSLVDQHYSLILASSIYPENKSIYLSSLVSQPERGCRLRVCAGRAQSLCL